MRRSGLVRGAHAFRLTRTPYSKSLEAWPSLKLLYPINGGTFGQLPECNIPMVQNMDTILGGAL